MQLFRLVRAAILTGGLVLYAQDASMVLRTSVTYRTQRNSLTLSDEQRQQADQLSRDAEQANRDGKYGDAIRAYYHGLAVMRGVPWTPAFEVAAGLQGRLDHAIPAPGDAVAITLTLLYNGARTDGIKMTAVVALVPPAKSGLPEKSLASNVTINPNPAALPFTTRITMPADASGDY